MAYVNALTVTVLPRAEWEPLAAAHAARVDTVTAGRRERAGRGEPHAVDDFLYDYYSVTLSTLRRWHPGAGVVLEGAADHAGWRWYAADAVGSYVDTPAFWAARGEAVAFVTQLLEASAAKPLHLGCFGLHEWAMVYRTGGTGLRHALPLRLGAEGTDAVVEAHPVTCTHFDAFRFFTPEAVPRNATQLTRAEQATTEQPGCLHATMDLYKWCAKLSPAISSELQQDCFELAVEVRRVDMRASPYDVSRYGLEAIPIETVVGKRAYAQAQRDFAARGAVLRQRLLDECARVRALATRALHLDSVTLGSQVRPFLDARREYQRGEV